MGFVEIITNIDFSILDFIQENIRNTFLDPVMAVLGYLGEAGAVWIILGIVLLFFRKTRPAGVCMLAAMALGYLIGDIGIKHLVARPRPFLVNTDVDLYINAPTSHSFPSGHSTASFAAVTSLFGMLKEKRWIAYSALGLAILIVFSRLYNYVHYPSDVLCGILLGVICGLVMALIFKKTKLDKRLSGDLKYKSKEQDKKA